MLLVEGTTWVKCGGLKVYSLSVSSLASGKCDRRHHLGSVYHGKELDYLTCAAKGSNLKQESDLTIIFGEHFQ